MAREILCNGVRTAGGALITLHLGLDQKIIYKLSFIEVYQLKLLPAEVLDSDKYHKTEKIITNLTLSRFKLLASSNP